MGREHASRFWQNREDYHDMARNFERNIEIVHPPYVTSNGIGSRFITHDAWNNTKVIYYEYRGDSLK